jgi:hypothetical protein
MFADLVDELMGLDDAEVTERFRELELRRCGEEAELAALIAVVDARGIWGRDGTSRLRGICERTATGPTMRWHAPGGTRC